MTRNWIAVPLLACLTMGAALSSQAAAQTAPELISCQMQQGEVATDGPAEDNRKVVCDIRINSTAQISDVGLKVGGEEIEDGQLKLFDPNERNTAFLFLIDRSNPARAATVRRNLEFARNIARRAQSGQSIGIATFASEVSTILELGERNADLDAIVADVVADGDSTEFYTSAIEGVRRLAAVDAERKALVIMSDGKAEDTAYSMSDLVSRARQDGVVIYGMGFAERSVARPDLQVLRRAAEETGGPFAAVVGNEPIDKDFASGFFRYLESGGTLTADVPDISGETQVELDLTLADNTTVNFAQTLDVGSPPEPEPAPEPAPEPTGIAAFYANFDGMFPGASAWATDNGAMASLLLLLPFLILAAIAWLIFGRRDAEDETHQVEEDFDANATHAIPVGDADTYEEDGDIIPLDIEEPVAMGWFEMVDNQDDRFAITQPSMEIGRHSDCDFKLNNDSVHRRHAHFQFDPDMKPVITDLDTVNGVMVNGERVPRAVLQNGDLIQLGEVRFRYVAA